MRQTSEAYCLTYTSICLLTEFAYSPETSDVAMCPFQNLLPEPTLNQPLLDIIEMMGFTPEGSTVFIYV